MKPHQLPADECKYLNLQAVRGSSSRTQTLAARVDLRAQMPPVMDQEDLGSCTACALVAAHQFLDAVFKPSPLFVYYNTRWLDQQRGGNNPAVDDGSTLRQGIEALVQYGVCRDSLWPYLITKQGVKPSDAAYADGLNHQTVKYRNVRQTLTEMKTCLASGLPFVFGFIVYESFLSDAVARTGIVTMPKPRERVLGGHAVVAVGYDDSRKVLVCRNSWGTGWGDNGHFYLPYSYISSTRLASDFWVVTDVEV